MTLDQPAYPIQFGRRLSRSSPESANYLLSADYDDPNRSSRGVSVWWTIQCQWGWDVWRSRRWHPTAAANDLVPLEVPQVVVRLEPCFC